MSVLRVDGKLYSIFVPSVLICYCVLLSVFIFDERVKAA